MEIKSLPEHELARLREKAKEIVGNQEDYGEVYSGLLSRRLNHEPLQYIEEYIPFYSIQINVDSRALIPRPETEYLVELIKEQCSNPQKILDVGTGSGCIALMLKKLFPNAAVDAIDISDEALSLANENSVINNLEINLYQSDLLENVTSTDFDVIVANLPYIPTSSLSSLDKEVVEFEPLLALDGGTDGMLYINKLITQIEDKNFENTTLFLEVDVSHAHQILSRLSTWTEVKLVKDLVERDRYIIAKK